MRYFENKFPGIFLLPFSWLFGVIVLLRNFFYNFKIFKIVHVNCPVICVGNITVGGTGKTPTIVYLHQLLVKNGLKPAIVSRGYGRETSGTVVVCDGKTILATPQQGGDEPYLLAQATSAIIVVDEDRARGAQFIVEHFRPDVILMDDGYQHRRLYRDINILTARGNKPFGNRFVLPAGPLREPIFQGLDRADAVLINGDNSNFILHTKKPIFSASYKPVKFLHGQKNLSLHELHGKAAIAFCGLANPTSFFSTLENLGIQLIETIVFPDHYGYTAQDVEKLQHPSKKADFILTTEKDWVKLASLVSDYSNWFALQVELRSDGEEELEKFLLQRLKSVSMLYKKMLAF